LTKNGVPLAAQQPAARLGKSREIVLVPLWQKGVFTMFRATPGRSRNQTGIVLGVRGQHRIALLTGDHHYDKVLAAASKVPTFCQQPCVLVTPHHGGLAGNLAAADWLAVFPNMTTPISCGNNSYGHPMADVALELKAMQAGIVLWRTDVNGTWSMLL
jgi:beta-lactamase superfamily II metal-dependent hydrolase